MIPSVGLGLAPTIYIYIHIHKIYMGTFLFFLLRPRNDGTNEISRGTGKLIR